MGNTIAIAALHDKRARLAGEIKSTQAKVDKQRELLATLDEVIGMFEPGGNPELIPAIRPCRSNNLFFRHGEIPRLCMAALREAGRPIACREVVTYGLAAKGLEVEPRVLVQITERFRLSLAGLERKGWVRKIVDRPDTWWELVGD